MKLLIRPQIPTLALLLALSSACGSSSPVAPDQTSVEYSQTDLVVGNGAVAAAGNTVTINYALWLYSATATDHKGTQIDANTFTWILGTSQVKGLDQAVVGMAVGGTRRAIVPPSLAYGAAGNGPVPPNAALVFEIQLINVQ